MKKIITIVFVFISLLSGNTETGTSTDNDFDILSEFNTLNDSSNNDFINSSNNDLNLSIYNKFIFSEWNTVNDSSFNDFYSSIGNTINSSPFNNFYSSIGNDLNLSIYNKFIFSEWNTVNDSSFNDFYSSIGNTINSSPFNNFYSSIGNTVNDSSFNDFYSSRSNNIFFGSDNLLIKTDGTDIIGSGNMAIGVGDIFSTVVINGSSNLAIQSNDILSSDSVALKGSVGTNADNSVAIGSNSIILDNADNSVAIGSNSIADNAMTFSVGSAGFERRIVNVATPIYGTDAVNLVHLQTNFYSKTEIDDLAVFLINSVTTLESTVTANTNSITALESSVANISTTDTTLLESSITSLESSVTTLENSVTANIDSITALESSVATNTSSITSLDAAVTIIEAKTDSIAINEDVASFTKVSNITGNEHGIYIENDKTTITGGTTSTQIILEDDKISLSHVATGDPVVLSGIDDAVEDFDAVNKRQLDSSFKSAQDYTDYKFNEIDNKINYVEQNLRKEIHKATATSIALATPLHFNERDNFSMSIGIGKYESEAASAVNIGYRKEGHVFTVGTTLNKSQKACKAGYSFSF